MLVCLYRRGTLNESAYTLRTQLVPVPIASLQHCAIFISYHTITTRYYAIGCCSAPSSHIAAHSNLRTPKAYLLFVCQVGRHDHQVYAASPHELEAKVHRGLVHWQHLVRLYRWLVFTVADGAPVVRRKTLCRVPRCQHVLEDIGVMHRLPSPQTKGDGGCISPCRPNSSLNTATSVVSRHTGDTSPAYS